MIFIFFLINSFFLWKCENPPVENLCGIMYPWYWEQDWGDGVIKINSNIEIKLYSDTLRSPIGVLHRVNKRIELKDSIGYDLKQSVKGISGTGTLCIGDSCILIATQSNHTSNFYKCFWNPQFGGLFIKKSELSKFGMKYMAFPELICTYGIGLKYDQFPKIGVNIPNTCLNIRSGPSLSADIIGCVHSNDVNPDGESRLEILERNGLWARVNVVNLFYVGEYPKEGEETEDWAACPNTIKNEMTGWIKMIKENGFPKIWFSSGGY